MNKEEAKKKLQEMCELADKIASIKDELTNVEEGDDALFDTLDQVECHEIDFETAWNELENFYSDSVKCPYCRNMIEDIEECETDKVWNNNGDHILVRVCPHCGNMIADTTSGYMRLSDTEYVEA